MQQSLLKHDRGAEQQGTAAPTQGSASELSLDALYQHLHSSPAGLTSQEASKRLKERGPNEPTVVQRGLVVRQLLVFLANPLVLIFPFCCR